jgi:hypothetical protein
MRPDANDDPEHPFGGYRLDGLYVFGPRSITCALAALIADSLLLVTGTSQSGERTARIRYRAAELRRKYSIPELQAMEVARRQVRSGYGLYGRPAKPATSGRKRRVA